MEEESMAVRFVIVEVALLAKMPPLKVAKPVTEREDRVPTEVREEPVIPDPMVVAFNTSVPAMR